MSETQGLALAFGFGCGYNWLIGRLVQRGQVDGYAALWVVFGVFVTLCISALVHVSLPRLQVFWLGSPLVLSNQQHAAVYELKFFIAAGVPMLAGSLWRYWRTLN